MNFSILKNSNKYYGGSEKKLGVTDGKINYMIKFQKNTGFGKRFNHVSEYLGCEIFKYLGFKTQDTYLGLYNDDHVVACVDFTCNEHQFVPFNDVGESSLEEDKEKYQYSYNDIMKMLKLNKKLTNVNETIEIFWEMFIVDALLGNFDRHGANWGFIKYKNKYSISPMFDNGSCLFPQLITDEQIDIVLNSESETNNRVYVFPTSQVKLDNKKSSYYDIISSIRYKECNEALIKIYNKINLNDINSIIDNTKYITDKRKDFYKYIIKERFIKILEYSYNKLMESNNE